MPLIKKHYCRSLMYFSIIIWSLCIIYGYAKNKEFKHIDEMNLEAGENLRLTSIQIQDISKEVTNLKYQICKENKKIQDEVRTRTP